MLNQFEITSEATLLEARNNGKKCCKMCRYYKTPGYILNAMQWIKCVNCNPTKPGDS